ncbi:MAG: hypothetical protein E7652_04490 [Ruminococcaceae bacterium]|nr:hypothetical protein [Oscillospiraceae bacterium]
MRRIFTLVITMIMLFCILPFSSFSADGKNFCITLDANGGVIEGKSVYPINYGDYYSDVFGESLPVAVRDGYTLAGWLCEKYNYMLNVESSDYYAVYENTVFKAVWIDAEGDAPAENEKKYIMSFDPDGGIIEGPDVYRINTGDRYIDVMDKEPTVTREGYEFLGWLCEKYNYILRVNETDIFSVSENIVFKAQWERADRAYTVTLDPNGGTMTAKAEYKIDRGEFYVDRIGEIMPNPVRQGYTFDGWYNEKYDFRLSILPTAYHKYDENLTFIALWLKEEDEKAELKKDWLITLDGNGGDVIGQSVYPANTGDKYTDIFGTELLAHRPGFTLSGWYCEKYNYTLELNGISYFAVAEDVIFEAVWSKNNYLGIGVDGYNVILSRADEISHIRYAKGVYSDAASIKNSADCVELNERVISSSVTDGLFIKEMPEIATYSFWIKYKDGSTNILLARLTSPEQYVSVDGVTVNINGLHGIRDIFIAKGSYDSYSEVKNNGGVQISKNKIGDKHSYSYNVNSVGEYTLCIRYTDTSKSHKILKTAVYAKEPIYTEKGLQLEISNLENVKVIRTAYGELLTAGEIKRADGSRGFSANTIGNKNTYTIQYISEGIVSVAVVYQNGYTHIYHYDIKKPVPDVASVGNNIYLSGLEGLSIIRYVKGEYQSVNEIKNALGNKYIRNIEDNEYVIKDLSRGIYTLYIQYNDGSNYFYFTYVEETTVDASGVKVSSAFTDNMVLQRDERLSVWGFADEKSEGRTVAVTLGGKTAYATVKDGSWKAVFAESFSCDKEPKDLKIYSADGVSVIKDVLIGDVYFIIGQSNVHYTLSEEISDLKYHGLSHELEVDFDDSRNMRFFRISNADYTGMTGDMAQGTDYEYEDVYNGRVWQKPSDIEALINRNASTYEVFSALGYLFACNMTNETDVPIGMIQIEASGHPLTSFAPNHLAEKWGDEWYRAATNTYHNLFGSPSRYVYNQQIHPLRHFSIAGLIWYQGESDEYNTVEKLGTDASTFKNEFAELMTYFRSAFGNSDFPVYLNEFPAHTGGFDFGCSRVEVGVVPQILDNCYVVPSSDTFSNVSWYNSIHPYVKRIQANRLCNMVLANRFGVGNIEYVSGPLLESVDYTGNTAVLDFKYTADGLGVFAPEDFGNDIVGIEILCNGIWKKADAEITDTDKITVNAESEIKGVRYYRQSSGYYPMQANLCNSVGIPCVAFVDYK